MIGLFLYFIPALIFLIVVFVSLIIEERRLWPFDSLGEILALGFLSLIWPIIIGIGLYAYRDERKKKLAEVQLVVEAHYRDKWWD